MKNVRRVLAAACLAASTFAWQTGPTPSGAAVPAPERPVPEHAVVRANAGVDDALLALRADGSSRELTVVRVVGAPLQDLLAEPGFLRNVHALQGFLHGNDASFLVGADVSITDVLALELPDDGSAVLYTR